jgi:hypothetical protein
MVLESSHVMMYHDVIMTVQKFSSQARPELLEEVRSLAAAEGRQFQAVLDEALAEWVERKKGGSPRPEVIAHAKASIARHRSMYEELAK